MISKIKPISIISYLRQPNNLVLVLGFIAIWLLFNANLSAIVISIFLTYRMLGHLLSPRVFDSKLIRAIATPFVYILVLQSTVMVSWLISNNFPLDSTPILTLLFMLVSYVFSVIVAPKLPNKATDKPTATPWIRKADIIALLVCGVMLCFVVVAPMVRSGVHKKSSVISIITGGADDSAHLGMVNDGIQFNRGVFRDSDAAPHLRNTGEATGYPTGWAAANSAIIKSINPGVTTGTQSLLAYVISKVFWYFVLIFLFARAVFIFYESLARRKLSTPAAIWLGCGALLFSYFFLLDCFLEGFYTFIPQLIVIVLLCLALIQLSKTAKEARSLAHGSTLIIVILCVAGSLPWLLVLPAVVLASTLSLLARARSISFKIFWGEFFGGVLKYIPAYIWLALALLVQLYTSAGPGSSNSLDHSLLYSGGVGIYSGSAYLFVFAGIALCFVLSKKPSVNNLRAILHVLMATLFLAGFIYVFQLMHLPENRYYYFKVLDTFMVTASLLALVGFALLIGWISDNKDKVLALMVALILPLLALQFIGLNSTSNPIELTTFSYALGTRQSTPTVNESIYDELKYDATQQNYDNNNYVLYYQPKYSVQNYFSSMLLKSNKPGSSCYDAVFAAIYSNTDFETVEQAIQDSCAVNYTFTIMTDSSDVQPFKAQVVQAGLQGRVAIRSFEESA